MSSNLKSSKTTEKIKISKSIELKIDQMVQKYSTVQLKAGESRKVRLQGTFIVDVLCYW